MPAQSSPLAHRFAYSIQAKGYLVVPPIIIILFMARNRRGSSKSAVAMLVKWTEAEKSNITMVCHSSLNDQLWSCQSAERVI